MPPQSCGVFQVSGKPVGRIIDHAELQQEMHPEISFWMQG